MKEYLFTEEDINLIKFLRSNNPKNIWSEPIHFIFEYEEFYIQIRIRNAKEVILENSFEQFVMVTNLTRINSKFEPQELSELLSKNKNISQIYTVRTLLFFNKMIKINQNYFESTSFIRNPTILHSAKLNSEYECIADIGLLIILETGEKLNCFLLENDDDFARNNFYINDDLITEKSDLYQFTEV